MMTQAEALNRAARQFRQYEKHHQDQADAINPEDGHNFSVVGKLVDAMPLVRQYRGQIGLFLGGSTEWKEATMRKWGRFAWRLGIYYHVGRVNTARRLALANFSRATSVDGTSGTKFADTIQMLTWASQQQDIFA